MAGQCSSPRTRDWTWMASISLLSDLPSSSLHHSNIVIHRLCPIKMETAAISVALWIPQGETRRRTTTERYSQYSRSTPNAEA